MKIKMEKVASRTIRLVIQASESHSSKPFVVVVDKLKRNMLNEQQKQDNREKKDLKRCF